MGRQREKETVRQRERREIQGERHREYLGLPFYN